jgi:hypothetical protein
MENGKSDDSAAAVFDDSNKIEKKASSGSSSVASGRFEARMHKKMNTSAANGIDNDGSKLMPDIVSAGSSLASRFEARMRKKLMSGSTTQSAADNGKDAATTSSHELMTQEENSRMHVEIIDDSDAPMPLQMDVMMEEEDEDEERCLRKINQEQTATSSNAQQLPLMRPPPPSMMRHDTTPEADISSHELYAVTAELVEESGRSSTEHRSFDEEVYEAIVVPPKWKEYRVIIGAGILIVVVVIVLGIVLGTREQKLTVKVTAPPTMQPTHDYDCIVRDDGPLTSECLYFCSIALDGESGILALNYYNRIQFLSHKNQTVEAVSSNAVDFKYGPASISGDIAVLGVDSSGVHVFERDVNNTDTWTEVQFLLPDDCPEGEADSVLEDDVCNKKARFGYSVDVDGHIIVLGASNVIDVTGAAFVYRRNDTMWVKDAKFESSKEMDRFGWDVSVRQDRIAVASKGSVSLYDLDPTSKSWIQAGVPIVNEECDSSEYWFGYSIALVGTHGLLIGCPSGNNSVGTVRYFTRDPSTGEYIEQQIVSPFDQTIKLFGSRISVDADGENVVAISTQEERKGSIFLFTLVDDHWVETARIRSPGNGIKSFGGDIAVSGGRVIVSSESNVHSYFLNCI